MIYITGDCHKDFSRFTLENFSEQGSMTRDDYVIICGDFGGVWWNRYDTGAAVDKFDLNWLQDKPFTTLFVDGNHENFDELYQYPVKGWGGGRVRELRPNVLHLMRGEIYELSGKKIFTFGGAKSYDIRDGIIEWDKEDQWKETARQWKIDGRIFRINHWSWWEQELPTQDEIDNAYKNLEQHNYEVDYIITHCCPNIVLKAYFEKKVQNFPGIHAYEDKNILTNFFDDINAKVQFKKWIFGHHHDDIGILDKYIMLYYQIVRIV